MHYKRGFIQIIVAIVVLLVAIGAFVAIVDPYQQYRQHEKYLGNQRLEIAGVARHHDYNAVITGSSMAMNHYPSQVDSLWGGGGNPRTSVLWAQPMTIMPLSCHTS